MKKEDYKTFYEARQPGQITVAEVNGNRFLVTKLGKAKVNLNNGSQVFATEVNRFYVCESIREAQRLQWQEPVGV